MADIRPVFARPNIAGKTNPFDRALQKKFGRKAMKVLQWINGLVKSNAILGNLNSAISQWFNLPNGVAMIKNPVDLANGMKDYVESLAGDSAARRALDQSDFMTERYLDEAEAQFDDGLLQQPKKFATWLLTVGDKQASQVIWFSAYEQGMQIIRACNSRIDQVEKKMLVMNAEGELEPFGDED